MSGERNSNYDRFHFDIDMLNADISKVSKGELNLQSYPLQYGLEIEFYGNSETQVQYMRFNPTRYALAAITYF